MQVRMTQDIPGDGYYFSAMKAFVTRTAYANIRGDQMVSPLSQPSATYTTRLLTHPLPLFCAPNRATRRCE